MIITIIVSLLFGVTSPIAFLGLNLPNSINSLQTSHKLFSQVTYASSLSEVNPLESLGKVTAPLDSLLGGLGRYTDIKPWLPKSALEGISGLEGTLDSIDNVSVGQVLKIAKSGFILIASILVTVLEIALRILRSVLGVIR